MARLQCKAGVVPRRSRSLHRGPAMQGQLRLDYVFPGNTEERDDGDFYRLNDPNCQLLTTAIEARL